MKTLVRAGIVTVAATVGLGTAGFAVASAADTQEPVVVKREDTSSSWTQSTDVDDDLDDLDDLREDLDDVEGVDSPTSNTVNTVNTTATKNTAPTSATGD